MTSIAMQLANNAPAVQQHISNTIAERSNIISQSLRDL